MRWAGHVARIGEDRKVYKVYKVLVNSPGLYAPVGGGGELL
jgi:hypothetical protein